MSDTGFVMEMRPSRAFITETFVRLGESLRIFTVPLETSIKEVISKAVERNFDEQGPGWAPLSPTTVAIRQREGYPAGPILVRSGALRRIATSLGIWDIDGVAGTADASLPDSVWYGIVHQEGSAIAQIPARPFLTVSDEDADKVAEVFGLWLDERVVADMVTWTAAMAV